MQTEPDGLSDFRCKGSVSEEIMRKYSYEKDVILY